MIIILQMHVIFSWHCKMFYCVQIKTLTSVNAIKNEFIQTYQKLQPQVNWAHIIVSCSRMQVILNKNKTTHKTIVFPILTWFLAWIVIRSVLPWNEKPKEGRGLHIHNETKNDHKLKISATSLWQQNKVYLQLSNLMYVTLMRVLPHVIFLFYVPSFWQTYLLNTRKRFQWSRIRFKFCSLTLHPCEEILAWMSYVSKTPPRIYINIVFIMCKL